MRFLRIAVTVSIGLLFFPAVASGAPARGTTRYSIDSLDAMWILPGKGERFFALSVVAYRRTNLDTGQMTLSGAAGRGACEGTPGAAFGCGVYFKRGWKVVRFESDPAFATATVVLKRRSQEARVSWTTSTPFAWLPPVAQNPNGCNAESEGTVSTIYVSGKNATAEGQVLGRDVATANEVDEERASEHMVQQIDVVDCP